MSVIDPLVNHYEGLVTRDDIEAVYVQIKSSGFVMAMFGISVILASGVTMFNIVNTYRKGLTEKDRDKPIDVKLYFDMILPVIKYIGLVLLVPVITLLAEVFFSEMEQNTFLSVQDKPLMDMRDYIIHEYVYYLKDLENFGINNLGLLIPIMKRAFILSVLAPIGMLLDNYLYSFALVGRYFYLLLLEMSAPFAILSTLHSETKSFFTAWLRNMFACYMLIPAFMLANAMVLGLSHLLLLSDEVSILLFIVLMALKIALYKKTSLVRNLIS